MGDSIDLENVSAVSQQYFATKWQTIKKLIGFFTLTKEECRDAGIDVIGEGRAEEGNISTLSSPEGT